MKNTHNKFFTIRNEGFSEDGKNEITHIRCN